MKIAYAIPPARNDHPQHQRANQHGGHIDSVKVLHDWLLMLPERKDAANAG